MKYIVAICLLTAPLAMSVAPTPAEAGVRNCVRCQWVKKPSWRYGNRRFRWVRACNRRPAFNRRRRCR